MTARRKKACCSSCAAGHRCASAPRRRSPYVSPISRMTDAQLRRFTARNPKRLRERSKDNWVRAKIRLLRHEGYPETQAVAIAMHMAGMGRSRTTRRSPPRRATVRRRRRS